MTLEGLPKAKRQLEKSVLDLIEEFQKTTGHVVTDVRLEAVTFANGHRELYGVKVTAEIP